MNIRKIFAVVATLMLSSGIALASPTVIVREVTLHQGQATENITIDDAQLVREMIIARLAQKSDFAIFDNDSEEAHYILTGTVIDICAEGMGASIGDVGLKNNRVIAHVNIRLIERDSNNIVAIVKGEGSSSSAYLKAKVDKYSTVKLGNYTVTLDSVHNALQKAAFIAVDAMLAKNLSLRE